MQIELFQGLGEKMWYRTGEKTILLPSALPLVFLWPLEDWQLSWLPKSVGKVSVVLGEASDVGKLGWSERWWNTIKCLELPSGLQAQVGLPFGEFQKSLVLGADKSCLSRQGRGEYIQSHGHLGTKINFDLFLSLWANGTHKIEITYTSHFKLSRSLISSANVVI